MIRAHVFGEDSAVAVEDLDTIAELVQDRSQLVWIDACDVDDGELARLQGWFDLHELEVEDMRERGQRAKLERYPHHTFMVAYARAHDGDLTEVDFVVGPSWLLTVRERNAHGELFEVDDLRGRYDRTRAVDRRVGFLLYTLLDSIVDGYFDAVEASEDRLEEVEDQLFDQGPPPSGGIQHDLLALRRELVLFRRRVVPLRDVVMAVLRREIPYVEDDALVYFEDVLDHILRLLDQVDTQRELMGNVVDASLALNANRMNQVMKKMTSWGAILVACTLITGIYGMNFQDMPELDWRFGYPAALALMLAVALGLHSYFKRKDWL